MLMPGAVNLFADVGIVYAFWHSKTFALVPFFKDARMGILTLRDWRNVIYDRICRQFGYSTLPITNSGRAALELKKLLEQGRAIGLAVDGPHGPAGTVKPGVFFLAKTTGRPIVAMHVRALKSFRLKSRWDRYEIPWPFSEVVISPARPLWVTVENEKESERMIRIHLGDL